MFSNLNTRNINSGILEVEENEIRLQDEKPTSFFHIGLGRDKLKYMLIEIKYNIKEYNQYFLYSVFHLEIEGTIYKLNKELNSIYLLNYYGVYYVKDLDKYFLVFEMPKNKMSHCNNVNFKRFWVNKENNLKQLFALFKKFKEMKIYNPYLMSKSMYFIDDLGNFQILYLGDHRNLKEGSKIDLPNLKTTYNHSLLIINSICAHEKYNIKFYLFHQYIIFVLFIFTGDEIYLNNYDLNELKLEKVLIENKTQISNNVSTKIKRVIEYYLKIREGIKSTSDNIIVDILFEFIDVILQKMGFKTLNQFIILSNSPVTNLKSKRVDKNYFFDRMFLSDNNKLINKNPILIDITTDKDDIENKKCVYNIIPKLFISKKEFNDPRNRDINEIQLDGYVSNIEVGIHEFEYDRNENYPGFEDLSYRVKNYEKRQYGYEIYDQKMQKKLNFMYIHFPSGYDKYRSPDVPITIYKKDFGDYLENSIENRKFEFLCKKSKRDLNSCGGINKLLIYKKNVFNLEDNYSNNSNSEEKYHQMNKVWDCNKLCQNERKIFINKLLILFFILYSKKNYFSNRKNVAFRDMQIR